MLTYVLIALAVLAAIVAALLLVVATRPTDFRVARTHSIAAPPEIVFAQVNDFRKWRAWSPYDKRDPQMKRTYEGPPAGIGASYTWSGNNEVGEGRSTIIESREYDLIRIKLEFVRPFTGISTAEFTFAPSGDQTAVTWSLSGQHSFIAKAVGLCLNMDKMIGGDFEAGLADLKSLVESRGPAQVALP